MEKLERLSDDYKYTILAVIEGELQPAYDADDLTSVSVAVMELLVNGVDKNHIVIFDNETCEEVDNVNLYAN